MKILNKIFSAVLFAAVVMSFAACTPTTAPNSGTPTGGSSSTTGGSSTNSTINFDPSTIPVPADSELTETVTPSSSFSPSDGSWTYISLTENATSSLSALGSSYSSYSLTTTKAYVVMTFNISSGTAGDTLTEYGYNMGTITGGDIQTIKPALLNFYQQQGSQIEIQDNGSFVIYRNYSSQDIETFGQKDIPRATISSASSNTITTNTAHTKYKFVSNSSLLSNTKWYFVKN